MNMAAIVAAQARNRPEHVALVQGDRTMTYAELDELSGRIAYWLREHGIQAGDRVLFYSDNSIELLATFLATARVAAVFAPVNAGFKRRELEYVAANARAEVAFVSARLAAEFRGLAADIPDLPDRVVVVGGEPPADWHSFDELTRGPAHPIVDVAAALPVLISYTSGSTSFPKPVLRTHGGEYWNAETYADVWDFRPDDRALVSLPLAWVYGLSTMTQALFAAGATVILLSHFNPVRVLETIEQSAVTLFAGTSTMYVKMIEVFRKQPSDLSSLRNCYIGGEPINRAVAGEFERITGARLWEGYAATEAAPILVTMPRFDADAPHGTCGRLVAGAQIRLIGPDGTEVSDGEAGEAQFTCPGQMLEYFREPELTAGRLTEDGWVRSGDLLRRDEGGFYFVVGRLNDMIIRGGANIAPAEVEAAIVGIGGVLDATVVSVTDESYGEAVVAFVTTEHSDIGERQVRDALGRTLAAYKIPSRFFFNAALPSGSTGKKDRRAAAALAGKLVREGHNLAATTPS